MYTELKMLILMLEQVRKEPHKHSVLKTKDIEGINRKILGFR
jgi:hypothetical protein